MRGLGFWGWGLGFGVWVGLRVGFGVLGFWSFGVWGFWGLWFGVYLRPPARAHGDAQHLALLVQRLGFCFFVFVF